LLPFLLKKSYNATEKYLRSDVAARKRLLLRHLAGNCSNWRRHLPAHSSPDRDFIDLADLPEQLQHR